MTVKQIAASISAYVHLRAGAIVLLAVVSAVSALAQNDIYNDGQRTELSTLGASILDS